MSKLDELRNYVAKLFENATDADIIKSVGAVTSKIDEISAEHEQKDKEYNDLLKDYKDVVIHSVVKPEKGYTDTCDGPAAFNADEAFARAMSEFAGK